MDQDPIRDLDEERRLQLQAALLKIAPKAWYLRPADNRMTYPCFLYRPSKPFVLHADNRAYAMRPCWNVIYISQEPSLSIIRQMMEAFEWLEFDREYESDNLFHYSFALYY